MKKFLIFLLILCLCGCAMQEEVPAPAPEPESIAPAPAPVPPPEPQPIITPGRALTVDGTDLSHCSVLLDEVPYVELNDLLEALDAEYQDP